jgi:hypothetical protein
MNPGTSSELLALSQKLLDAVAGGDWQTYRTLVADDLTCSEPEARAVSSEGFTIRCANDRGRRITNKLSPTARLHREAAGSEP